MDRNEIICIFDETMKLCSTQPLLVNCVTHSKQEQKIIWQDDPLYIPEKRYAEPARVILSPKRTFEAARKYVSQRKHVCALNSASPVTPGGGVMCGTTAQEGSMCMISTLYASISDKESVGVFYERHCQMICDEEMGIENRDDCIFTPAVKVIREDSIECNMLPESEWYSVDVITCAAPDLRYKDNGKTYRPSTIELIRVFENRWRRILSVAAQHKAEVLILGAFGCGTFQNPPEVVVQAFNNVCDEYKYCFETIEFAVYGRNPAGSNYVAFRNILGIREETSLLGYLDIEDIEGYARALQDKTVQAELAEYCRTTNDSRKLEKLMCQSEGKDTGLAGLHDIPAECSTEDARTLHETGSDEFDKDGASTSKEVYDSEVQVDNGIMISEAAFAWHKLLSLVDFLNRRVKEPGWRYEDKQAFYQLKDRMLISIMRRAPRSLTVSLFFIPYIQYSSGTKERAGELMRGDRNQYSFEYYLTQVPPTANDVEIPEKAMVELQVKCLGETYRFHMPAQLVVECGIILGELPRKEWIAAPEFHHNMFAEAEPIIESLLDEVDRWRDGEQYVDFQS